MRLTKSFIKGKSLAQLFRDMASIFLLVLLGIFISKPIFQPGLPLGTDIPCHLFEDWYVATKLIPHYHRVIGWNPNWSLGYPTNQFYPPLGSIIFSIFYYLCWGMDTILVYKIYLFTCYIVAPLSIYFFMRKAGFGFAAFFGAFFSLSTEGGSELGGFGAIFRPGFQDLALGMALVVLSLAVYQQALKNNSYYLGVISSLIMACSFLTYTVSGIYIILGFTIYSTLFAFHQKKYIIPCKMLLLIGVIGLSLVTFWVIPGLAKQQFFLHTLHPISPSTLYEKIIDGRIFGEALYISQSRYPSVNQLLIFLSVTGVIASNLRKNRMSLFLLTYLVVIVALCSLSTYPFVATILIKPNRSFALIRILLLMFAGIGCSELLRISYSPLRKINGRDKLTAAYGIGTGVFLLVGLMILILVVGSVASMASFSQRETVRLLSNSSPLWDTYNWLRINVPNDSRIAYECMEGRWFLWLMASPYRGNIFGSASLHTGHESVGGSFDLPWPNSPIVVSMMDIRFNNVSAEELYDELTWVNAGYVVAYSDAMKSLLSNEELFIEEVTFGTPSDFSYGFYNSSTDDWEIFSSNIGEFTIFRLRGYTPCYAFTTDPTVIVDSEKMDEMHLRLHVENAKPGTRIIIKESYFINWKAYANGEELSVRPYVKKFPKCGSLTLIEVILSRKGSYEIDLVYIDLPIDTISAFISGLAWLSTLGYLILGIPIFRKWFYPKIHVPPNRIQQESPKNSTKNSTQRSIRLGT